MTKMNGRHGTYYRRTVHAPKTGRHWPNPLRLIGVSFEWAYTHSPMWTIREATR